jgi:DNA repair protein SbcC/Rad50
MTLLTRVFRPASPLPKTLDEKIAELASQSAEIIAGIALNSDETELRSAAIAKLGIGNALFKLADTIDPVQRVAQQRIAQLIDANALDFAEFCRRTANTATLLSVAGFCSDPARLQQVVVSITDVAVLSKLAVEGVSTKVRQLAAEAIHDVEQLRHVLKEVGSKDKSVYKIIKHKLDARHAEEKAAAELQASIDALCAALERHVHHPFDNLFAPTLEHLNTQWNALAEHASPDSQVRAEAAIDRSRGIITQHVQAVASQAARAGAIANADANRQSVLADLCSVLKAIYESESVDVSEHVAQCKARWSEVASYKSASATDQATYQQLNRAITEVAALIAQHGSLATQAEHFHDSAAEVDLTAHSQALRKTLAAAALLNDAMLNDTVPAIVTEAAAALSAWEQSGKDKLAAEANALRQLSGLIRKASSALSDGKTGQTAGMRRAIEERLRALPSIPTHLATQLAALDEKLSLLQDWRSYAVAPKRIELIEQMEALIGAEEAPQVLADNIKRLQDEWKLISKGNTENTDAEWQRFHQAAQTAYQPCRDYFAAQSKQREGNLNSRKALLKRLGDFVAAQNWEQCDWRDVARALRESKQQWRAHHIVERAANKPLQEIFDALTADLESKLEAESAKNTAEKKSLIARAQQALHSDDGREATDEVKRLQLAWKNVGIVARDDDQKLWAEFRAACDAIFAKRQQAHTDYVSTLDESKSKALALCVEAEQVAALSGAELLEGAKKLSALSELFEALGDLPKANARDLHMRFERALDRCEKRIAEQRARDKSQAWNNVLDAGGKIREYRFAVFANASADECDALKQVVQTFIDSVPVWPKGGLQAIKSELAKTDAANIETNETALRTLCIRAEILTDTATPTADQAFRRTYQLQRLTQGLNQGLGQARGSTKEELDAMVFEWIGIGVTRPEIYSELLERFNRCRAPLSHK